MFKTETIDLVKNAIKEETINAKKHGNLYHSNHEAYSIIREEVDEATECINAMNTFMRSLWDKIKQDEPNLKHEVDGVYSMALWGAMECIQVAACINKFLDREERGL